MTTDTLLDTVRGLLSNDLDAYTGSDMADEEILPVVNMAQREIARRTLYYNPIQTVTASVSNTYRLNMETATGITEPVYDPIKVWYGTAMTSLAIVTMAELDSKAPNWRASYSTSTSPAYAVIQEPYLWFYGQIPAGNAIHIHGLVYPADITLTGLTPVGPSLASDLHFAVALRAAIRLSAPLIGENEAIRRVSTYWSEMKTLLTRHYNKNYTDLYDDGTEPGDYGRYQIL